MKENVFENPVEVRSTAPAPHFADQSVVQRAQPVVPLDEIRTKVRLRRIWVLGGAFVLAIVLGAASALVAVRLKSTTTTQSEPNIPETETVATQTDPPQVEETPVVEEAAEEAVAEEETEPEPSVEPEITRTPAKQNPAPQRARVAEREYEPLEPERRRRERDRVVEPSEEERLEQIRESVLYERWQERRARRARREQRRNRRGGDRDLTHVDELFEGPRRPDRPRY